MSKYLRTSDAAKILGITPEYVRQLERTGKLPAFKTVGGYRVFDIEEVKTFAAEREKQKQTRLQGGSHE